MNDQTIIGADIADPRLDYPTVQSGVAAGLQLAEMRAAKTRVGQKVVTATLNAMQRAAENPNLSAVAVEIIDDAYEIYLLETGKDDN